MSDALRVLVDLRWFGELCFLDDIHFYSRNVEMEVVLASYSFELPENMNTTTIRSSIKADGKRVNSRPAEQNRGTWSLQMPQPSLCIPRPNQQRGRACATGLPSLEL